MSPIGAYINHENREPNKQNLQFEGHPRFKWEPGGPGLLDIGRREDLRVGSQEGRARSFSEQIRAPQELKDTREEAPEEGVLKVIEELPKLSLYPSKEFKEELAKTLTTGTEVIMDSAEEEMGLQKVRDLVENQGALSDEDVMEMDEIRAACLEHGIDMDNPQDLSEEEPEGEAILQEEGDDIAEEKEDGIGAKEKEMVLGEPVKKQGFCKRLFKPTISTAGSNKMRIVNALVSPRKRGVAKTGSRYGENSKTLEGNKWFAKTLRFMDQVLT
ncbi:hypothetical protein DY000_02024268 [Brassica cretica]|uniref:Uncharacterized protein n=1 Tax=Brassica cretica TaxID=69181 RepID=A0ABQ7E887_BRACR|nr:hypothetical protein DY000_02024268 [Brassica cretica]